MSRVIATEPTQPNWPRRWLYLDGLRGIAVLFVVLDHIFRSTLVFVPYVGWRATLRDLLNWISNGRMSLAFFIVLSGYFLMGPVLADGQLRGGMRGYFQRRAKRLLPAYYAAFFAAWLLIRLLSPLQSPSLSIEWKDALPAHGAKMILAHLLLIHNFTFHWAFQTNPPIWTMATLAQIYLLFPLLLLPIWRRLGMAAVVAFALIFGLGIFLLTGKGHAAALWFLALFTFGMAAADIERRSSTRFSHRQLFGWLAVILLVGYAIITLDFSLGGLRRLTPGGYGWEFIQAHWFFDCLFALGSACLLLFAASVREGGHWLVKCLSCRWLVAIGAISYSLYLIHDPLLAVMKIGLDRARLGPYQQFLAYLVVGLPILLLASYLFYRIFERPFMLRQTMGSEEARLAKAVAPA